MQPLWKSHLTPKGLVTHTLRTFAWASSHIHSCHLCCPSWQSFPLSSSNSGDGIIALQRGKAIFNQLNWIKERHYFYTEHKTSVLFDASKNNSQNYSRARSQHKPVVFRISVLVRHSLWWKDKGSQELCDGWTRANQAWGLPWKPLQSPVPMPDLGHQTPE